MTKQSGVDDKAEGAEECSEASVGGFFFEAGEDVIHGGAFCF